MTVALCTTAPKYYYSISSSQFAEWFSYEKSFNFELDQNNAAIVMLPVPKQYQTILAISDLNLIRNGKQVFVSEKISISTIILVSEIQFLFVTLMNGKFG